MNASRVLLTSLAVGVAGGTARAHPPWYTMKTIPTLPGYPGVMYPKSINDLGQAVGQVSDGSNFRGFIWLPATAYGLPAGTSLLTNFGNPQSDASGINNAGQVSGSAVAAGQWDVARWDLASGPLPVVLHNKGITRGISSTGVVAGNGVETSFSCNVASVFNSPGTHAAVGGVECANSVVMAINAAGMAVGNGFQGSNKGFVAYPPMYSAVELPNFAGVVSPSAYTLARAVNESGQVAVQVNHLTLGTVAAIYQDLNGNGIPDPATEYTILSKPASGTCGAHGINNSGVVTGGRASDNVGMIWFSSREYNLNQCVVKGTNGFPVIRNAVDINNVGQVLCHATTTLGELAVVLTPHCYADCDQSGSLTANDFQCFLDQFAGKAVYANCDDSTGTPGLTANDFICYINAFANGCP